MKHYFLRPSFLLFLTLIFFVSIFPQVNQDGDLQYWQFFSLSKQVSESRNIFIQTELRTGDSLSKPYFYYIQAIDIHTINSWLSLGPGYRQLVVRSDDAWKPAYSPFFDLIVNGGNDRFNLTNRVRVHYQFGPRYDHWIFRDRIWLTYPFQTVSWVLSEEVFITQYTGFSQNRFYFGPLFHLPKEIDIQLFYQIRNLKDGEWKVNHIFGCYFFFSF